GAQEGQKVHAQQGMQVVVSIDEDRGIVDSGYRSGIEAQESVANRGELFSRNVKERKGRKQRPVLQRSPWVEGCDRLELFFCLRPFALPQVEMRQGDVPVT